MCVMRKEIVSERRNRLLIYPWEEQHGNNFEASE